VTRCNQTCVSGMKRSVKNKDSGDLRISHGVLEAAGICDRRGDWLLEQPGTGPYRKSRAHQPGTGHPDASGQWFPGR
jgi:hypothetical protein